MNATQPLTPDYFPPPESSGGWRYLLEPEEIRSVAGMDPDLLDLALQRHEFIYGSESWGIAVIRHGYLVQERYTFNVLPHSRFDIWSGTKSFTGTAWGLLLEMSRQNQLPGGIHVDLDSPAYQFIPEGYPLTDPRKERILFRHLLTMTSGIPGEASGVYGMPTATNVGAFEHALGKAPNRYGRWTNRLVAEPGAHWEYSDPAMCHLALAFANILKQDMDAFLQERVFRPIGIENLSWDVQGGSGFLGPHTNAHTGVHVSTRELARFGYLALHGGAWAGEQIIPKWWMELDTRSSQADNPDYGFTWWVNTAGKYWPRLPRDAFALSGYRSNRCYIIPSLDMVVVRIGSGTPTWEEQGLITGIVDAVR
jgi:CubicO group peptidase (beta-lactamase class C family)